MPILTWGFCQRLATKYKPQEGVPHPLRFSKGAVFDFEFSSADLYNHSTAVPPHPHWNFSPVRRTVTTGSTRRFQTCVEKRSPRHALDSKIFRPAHPFCRSTRLTSAAPKILIPRSRAIRRRRRHPGLPPPTSHRASGHHEPRHSDPVVQNAYAVAARVKKVLYRRPSAIATATAARDTPACSTASSANTVPVARFAFAKTSIPTSSPAKEKLPRRSVTASFAANGSPSTSANTKRRFRPSEYAQTLNFSIPKILSR